MDIDEENGYQFRDRADEICSNMSALLFDNFEISNDIDEMELIF